MVRNNDDVEDELRKPAPTQTPNIHKAEALYVAGREGWGEFLIARVYGSLTLYRLTKHGYICVEDTKVRDRGRGKYLALPDHGSVKQYSFHSDAFLHPTVDLYKDNRMVVLQKYAPNDFQFQLRHDGSIHKTPVVTSIPQLAMPDILGMMMAFANASVDFAIFGENREFYLKNEIMPDVDRLFEYIQRCLESTFALQSITGPRYLYTTLRWLADGYRFSGSSSSYDNLLMHGFLMQSALLSYIRFMSGLR